MMVMANPIRNTITKVTLGTVVSTEQSINAVVIRRYVPKRLVLHKMKMIFLHKMKMKINSICRIIVAAVNVWIRP